MQRLLGVICCFITVGCLSVRSDVSDITLSRATLAGPGEFPAVTKIFSVKPDLPNALCSGTWVYTDVLLTAAHCLKISSDRLSESIWVIDPKTGGDVKVHPSKVLVHPLHEGRSFPDGAFDVALVQFDRPISEYVLAIAQTNPQVGDDVQLIGYGFSSVRDTTAGSKRFGRNKIFSVDGQIDADGFRHPKDVIYIKEWPLAGPRPEASSSAPQGSVNLKGDSGGPMLLGGRIIGVASSAYMRDESRLAGNYVSISAHQQWLSESGLPICGLTRDCQQLPSSDDEARRPLARFIPVP